MVVWATLGLALPVMMLLLLVDTIVYSLYRFHLSGFVWELVTGPAAGEIFQISTATIVWGLTAFGISLLMSLTALSLATVLSGKSLFVGKLRYCLCVWLTTVLSSQMLHIWYEAHYDAEITGVTRHLPIYYPATAKRFMAKHNLIEPEKTRSLALTVRQPVRSSIKYPFQELNCEVPENPKNVLVIVVDAMREDVLSHAITPNLYALSQDNSAQVFTEHFSGGNVTKSGLFSLFYGLPTSYWDGFAAAGIGAEWISQHQAGGYEMGIFSSSSLLSPAFDRTVFSSIPDLRQHSEGESPSERDKQAILELDEFLVNRTNTKPFFGFLFLDAVHSYDVPDGFEKFTPQWDSVDHVKLNNNFNPNPYFNRYKNALYFVDSLLGDMLSKLDARRDLDNTVIILTSDHGEEFNDLKQNYWGHGSNFTKYQTQVPLVILWPGKTRQVYTHKTSHFDVAPTIMSQLLGCSNPANDYAVGRSLFDSDNPRDWLLVHSYFNYGLVTDDKILSTYPVGGFDIRDSLYHRITNVRLESTIVLEALEVMSRFYR